MMSKYLVFCIINFFFVFLGYGQKPALSFDDLARWSSLDKGALSNNGKYAAFVMTEGNRQGTLFVATDNSWKETIWDTKFENFINDQEALIKVNGDSIGVVFLGMEDKIEWIQDVGEYEILYDKILIFKHKIDGARCTIVNLDTKQLAEVDGVVEIKANVGRTLVLLKRKLLNTGNDSVCNSIDVVEKNITLKNIWSGPEEVVNLRIGDTGEDLCFAVRSNRQFQCDFWSYKKNDRLARRVDIINDTAAGYKILEDPLMFDKDHNVIFFRAELMNALNSKNVDMILRSSVSDKVDMQSFDTGQPAYWFVLNINTSVCKRITDKDEELEYQNESSKDHVIVFKQNLDPAERTWNYKKSAFLLSLATGKRIFLGDYKDIALCKISPNNRYVMYYDRKKYSFFTYNVESGHRINITQKIPFPVYDENNDRPHLPLPYSLEYFWLPSDDRVFIYDRFDIWEVDPDGLQAPLCLTSKYGRRNGITLRFMYDEDQNLFNIDNRYLLCAVDTHNQDNGFFSLIKSGRNNPEPLTLTPSVYCRFRLSPEQNKGEKIFFPIKAKNSDLYLVRSESATESPNYFVTQNFKTFKQITDIHPERQFNWLTSELMSWYTFDSSLINGILYKPENFDSTKIYPIIFYFYERLSETVNRYIKPEYFNGSINIPFLVSNGFLVFVPDIHYKSGETANSVYNCVCSAADYLSQFRFVDSNRMGIQGHSFGGYEVNALITSTDRFAAAASACGPSNLFSFYSFAPEHLERQQVRMGSLPWRSPGLYIKNSPMLNVSSAHTPILLMCGMLDQSVPPSESIAFYNALKREGKVAWLLVYNDSGHQVGNDAAKDYTIRLVDFFNYYLRDRVAPDWMKRDSEQ